MVTELMESAPQAPALPQLEWIDAGKARKPRRSPAWRNKRTGRLTMIGGAGAVSIAALLLLALLPVIGQHQQSAAAAELHQIATNVTNRSVPQLKRDQWLETKRLASFSMDVKWIGSTSISGAEATVIATQTEWSNNFGETCVLSELGRAHFASSAAETTWTSVGLIVDPIQPPVSPCSDGGGANARNGDGLSFGSGTTDVSSLATDASALAHELSTGTTGISGLDQLGSGTSNPGFQRAVALLVGPLTGASPAFDVALYGALALLPGIQALGTTSTHTGSTGLGFESAGARYLGPTIIVVDPKTGALLEARNLEPGLFDPLASFVPFSLSTHGVGGNGGNKIQWIDPIGSSAVVNTASIPTSLSPSPPPTAVIVAIGKRGVSAIPLNALQGELYARLGAPGEGSGYGSASGGGVMTFTFDGPRSQVQDYAKALRHSDLIASVTVNYGDK
ncbi:MAG: hypothetical protein ABSC41_20150 [Acidimicrobiales bacterium]